MLSRLHAFVQQQLGGDLRSFRTLERSPERLLAEAVAADGGLYLAKTAASVDVAIEVDALLAADALGVPHAGLSGYELSPDDTGLGLVLTRRLPGVSLETLSSEPLSEHLGEMLSGALVLLHSRAVSGWGPLDATATLVDGTPVGTFGTWLASATYGLADALDHIDAAGVLQPEAAQALRDALSLTPDQPATGPRWLHGDLSSDTVIVSPDGSRFLGFATLDATECGDPARDLGRWVLRDGAPRVGPILNSYDKVSATPLDPWRVWWWALLDATHLLDRSIAHGSLSPQLDMPVRIVALLEEAGLRDRPPTSTR